MLIETYSKHNYQIFKFAEDLGVAKDLAELKGIVKGYLDKDIVNIALWFTQDSFLYTTSIGILNQIIQMTTAKNGSLTIIKPNANIIDVLQIVGLIKLVRTIRSEDDLPD